MHDALEMTVCAAGSNSLSFTPMQIVASASPAGAEMMTRLAPPFRWAAAFSRDVNRPVDSMTMSTPLSAHGISDGSRSASFLTSRPSIEKPLSLCSMSFARVRPTESCFNKKAIVSASPKGSLTATSSTFACSPRARIALVNERPMRPNPLMPTRTAIRFSSEPAVSWSRSARRRDYSRAASAFASCRGSWSHSPGPAMGAATGSVPSAEIATGSTVSPWSGS